MSIKYRVDELREGMILGEGVYSGKDIRMPLVAKNTVLTQFLIDKIQTTGIREVKIYSPVMYPNLIEVIKEPPVINEQLRQESVNYISDIFAIAQGKFEDASLASKTIKQLDNVVDQLISSLSMEGRSMVNINNLKSYDEYTYHHSLSVSVVSIAIAQFLGFSDKELTQIGKCAMLHDIGKIMIPIQIINKPSKLDDDEFTIIKSHPSEGYRYLSENNIGDEEIWNGVLYHHEKMDGAGYPSGLAGEEIPIISRIISVADVYDALTSIRPYRKPMQPVDALEFVMGGASNVFDYNIVTAFLEKIQPYPVGNLIELSNGRIAMVIDNEFPMRPIVQTLETGEVLDLCNDRHCLDLVITNLIIDSQSEA